jgi:methylamine dehydrogenase heavy chain
LEVIRMKHINLGAIFGAFAIGVVTSASAQLPPDPPAGSLSLSSPPSKHWVWVNDFVFPHMADGQALLVDGDSGRFLGMLSTGFGFARLLLPHDGGVIYSPETYFSRGTRGKRTDVVTLYDAQHLAPLGEIAIPAKRSSNVPMMANSALTDDDRFVLVYNFTPAQSVTVIDTRTRKLVGEIDTPGCALVYPTGPRSFFSICGDGSLLDITLNDKGLAAGKKRTAALFDVQHDPVTEKAVRAGDTWLFVSYGGEIYPIVNAKQGLGLGAKWSLLSDAERAGGWRPGGLQQLAIHAPTHRLYSIMHQGPIETHKDPGKDIWVYDLASKARVQSIAAKNLTGSIAVTTDAKPLLFGAFIGATTLDVYDALSGEHLHSVDNVGTTPTVLVTP